VLADPLRSPDTGVAECFRDGESGFSRLNLEEILVDLQRADLRFQRGPRDAQLGRSSPGSEYPAATFFQGGLNHFLLLCQESFGKLRLVFRFCQKRLLWQPALVD